MQRERAHSTGNMASFGCQCRDSLSCYCSPSAMYLLDSRTPTALPTIETSQTLLPIDASQYTPINRYTTASSERSYEDTACHSSAVGDSQWSDMPGMGYGTRTLGTGPMETDLLGTGLMESELQQTPYLEREFQEAQLENHTNEVNQWVNTTWLPGFSRPEAALELVPIQISYYHSPGPQTTGPLNGHDSMLYGVRQPMQDPQQLDFMGYSQNSMRLDPGPADLGWSNNNPKPSSQPELDVSSSGVRVYSHVNLQSSVPEAMAPSGAMTLPIRKKSIVSRGRKKSTSSRGSTVSGAGDISRPFAAHMCNSPGCGRSYKTNGLLRHHQRNHIPSHRRPYQCPDCNMGFVDVKDLKRHNETKAHSVATQQIHQQKFQCHIESCGYVGTNREDNLQRHLRLVHGQEILPDSSNT